MKILGFPNPSGSATWRLKHPFKYLCRLGHEAYVSDEGITQKGAEWADIFVLQNCADKEGIALLYEYQQEHGKKIVVDSDDFWDVDDDSPFKADHDLLQAPEVIKRTMEIADMITTTTPYLANKLKELNANVKVLPNYMDMEFWDIAEKKRNTSDYIRIGWAGSLTHMKDIKSVEGPLKQIMDEFPQVRMIFVGELRIMDMFKGYPVEYMLGVPMDTWPIKLNGLGLDIGIAPLIDSEFNRCKSNIKWQEYAIAKIPGVYSNIVYQLRGFEPRFGMIAYNEDQWYHCLKNLVKNPVLRTDIAEASYSRVTQRFSLKRHIKEWEKAYLNLT